MVDAHWLMGKSWKSRKPQFATIFVGLVLVTYALQAYHFNHFFEASRPGTKSATHFTGSIDHFFDPEDSFIGWPLQRVCNETTWTAGLVFLCDNNSGGIGNIRNFILTCIRYAIEAGATGLIMPQIQTRSEKDISELFKGFQPFDYFFDTAHFRRALSTHCPRMVLYNGMKSVPNVKERQTGLALSPKNIGSRNGCDERDLNRHVDSFRQSFNVWLESSYGAPTVSDPKIISINWGTQFEYPVHRDGSEFVATFGSILRLRQDVTELSNKILAQLQEESPVDLKAEFLGVHLRTESDALKTWPTFNDQRDSYLREWKNRGLQYAYLASGNETEAQNFKSAALTQGQLRTFTKMDLLRGKDLQLLQSLHWDQQALVDFLVLQKSTHFVGCSPSSFSINVALRRHLMEDGLQTRPWKNPGDQYSTLVGSFHKYWVDWLYMYDGTWP